MQKNILTVFIGSPGDLSDERTAIREEIDEINKTVGEHLGWLIDLRGWEDTSPGYARPQEKINRDVDACDLFVGMLWRRWGQSTGQYSSGFEEEFERAKRRRTDSASSPEIWLMFKKVSAEHSADPGEQLKRVLAFKKEQEEKKELLYKVFEDTTDFRKLIRRYLLEHLFSCNANLSLSQAEVSPPTKPDSLPAAMSRLNPRLQMEN
jgi:hypothetical protein